MKAEFHARAKAVFVEAVRRPSAERMAFVADACGSDELLRREVDSLLTFHRDRQSGTTRSPSLVEGTSLIGRISPGRASTGNSVASHLVRRAAQRLEFVCFAAILAVLALWGVVNAIQGELDDEFTSLSQWGPPIGVLVASIIMLLVSRSGRVDARRLIRAGLGYEVVVSIALAFGQYTGAFTGVSADAMNGDRIGLTYVAPWTLFFTVLVPAPPREALLALIASGIVVPFVYLGQVSSGAAPALDWVPFTSVFVWPYAANVAVAYIAARLVHQLGVEVRRAHELGSYRLEALLGQGGMGEVWRASHRSLARPAAIKIIRQDILGHDPVRAAAAAARFEAEAQVIASLESPHTVGLYDFGTTEDGTLYYVMELLDGLDLDALVRRSGPLPPARVVHILRQACASLAEAHHRGLVHQDITPANLYLCRRGLEHDVVKVLDFGLAAAITDAPTNRAVIGTPAYLAPELITRHQRIDGRADLYGLGAVAFWLLTARVVFERDTIAEVLHAHLEVNPTPPSSIAATGIPPALDELVMNCLEKTPHERPRDAAAMSARLEAIAFGLPWSGAEAARWWQDFR